MKSSWLPTSSISEEMKTDRFSGYASYAKAGLVFAATTATYFLARTAGVLPNWLQWGEAAENQEMTMVDKTVDMGSHMKIIDPVQLPDVLTEASTPGLVEFSVQSEINDAETVTGHKHERRLLSSSTDLLNPISDQIIPTGQVYRYRLDNVFAPDYQLLDVLETGQSQLPSWLGIEYEKVGEFSNGGAMTTTAIRLYNNHLFLSCNNPTLSGFYILDISNKTAPKIRSQYLTSDMITDMAIVNDKAFLARMENKGVLEIVNVSNMTQPVYLGSYANTNGIVLGGRHVHLTVRNNYAFLALSSNGLQIIDISNPASPFLVGGYYPSSEVADVALQGNLAFLSLFTGGKLAVLNISNPASPVEMNVYVSATPGSSLSLWIQNNLAFMARYYDGFIVFNITDPLNIRDVSAYNTPGVTRQMTVQGDIGIVADSDGGPSTAGVLIFDVSNASAPRLISRYGSRSPFQTVFNEGMLYIADSDTLQILDLRKASLVGTPSSTLENSIAPLTVNARNVSGVGAQDDFVLTIKSVLNPIPDQIIEATQEYQCTIEDIFSGSYDLLDIVETGKTELPSWLTLEYSQVGQIKSGKNLPGASSGPIEVDGNLLFIYSHQPGFYLFDITNKTAPTLLSNYSSIGGFSDIAINNQKAFLGAHWGKGALEIVDISNPTNPVRMSYYVSSLGVNLDSRPLNLAIQNDLAFLAMAINGLQIINISNPFNPQLVGSGYATAGISATGIAVQGTKAYVSFVSGEDGGGLEVIDVSNPLSPFRFGIYNTKPVSPTGIVRYSTQVHSVFVQNNFAFLSYYNGGFIIINITNPAMPTPISWYDTPDYTPSITVNGDIALVSDNRAGLFVFDVKDPIKPRLVGGFDPLFSAIRSAFKDGVVYMENESNLYIVDITRGLLKGTATAQLVEKSVPLTVKARHRATGVLWQDDFVLTIDQLPRVVETSLSDKSVFPNQELTISLAANSIFTDNDQEFLSLSVKESLGSLPLDWLHLSLIPRHIGGCPIVSPGGETIWVDVEDGIALTGNSFLGISVLDVSNPEDPQVLSIQNTGYTEVTLIRDRIGYVWAGGNGLFIYNLTVPSQPVLLVNYVNSGDSAQRLELRDNLIFSAAGSNADLRVINVADKSNPSSIGFYKQGSFYGQDLVIKDDLVFIGNAEGGVKILNISLPSNPQLVSSYHDKVTTVSSVAVKGNYLYVSDYWNHCLQIVNVTNPFYPTFATSFCETQTPGRLTIFGETLFIASGSSGLHIVDIRLPDQPKLLAHFDSQTRARNIVVAGHYAYESLEEGGLVIFDISEWQLRATPTLAHEGNHLITLEAIDRFGAKTEDSFILRVQGPPRINGTILPRFAKVGQTFNYFIPQGTFIDPNFDPISFTARFIDQVNLTDSDWLKFNGISATFSGIPTSSDKGNFTILLTATDNIAGSINTTFPLYVDHIPVANQPIARQVVGIGHLYQLTVPNATFIELDDDPLTFSAQRSNGLPLPKEWLTFQNASRLLTGTPNATHAGTYDLAIIATDPYEGAASAFFSLVVEYFPQAVGNISAPLAGVDDLWEFTVPDQTFVDEDDTVLIYSASRADGSELPSWLSFNPSSLTFAGIPLSSEVGILPLRLKASDQWGASAHRDFNVTITNFPTAKPIFDQLADVGQSYQFIVANNTFEDVDNEVLLYSAHSGGGGSLPGWLQFNSSTRTFSGTPNVTASYSLEVWASDPHNATVVAGFNLQTDHFPQANQSLLSKLVGVGASFSYLILGKSFTDADSDLLTYRANRDDGSVLPNWLSFNPSSVVFSGVPQDTDVGTVQLQLTATDPYKASAQQYFNITVTHFPTAKPISDQLADVGQLYQFTLANNTFEDADNEVLLYSVHSAGGSSLPGWLQFNSSTRTFSGTPNVTASYPLEVWASDSNNATVAVSFKLQTDHFPRVNRSLTSQLIDVGKSFSYSILETGKIFIDADGDMLTYSTSRNDGSALPNWLSFNPGSLTFLGVPLAGDVGSIGLYLTATDVYGASAQQNLTLTVTNFPVLSAALSNQVVNIGEYWQWQLSDQTFTDPDKEVLVYQVQRQDDLAWPSWLNFSASNLTFWGLPNLTTKESYVLSVVAEDPHGAKATSDFTLTAEHFPQMGEFITLPLAAVGKTFSSTVSTNSFVDDDGESLIYSCRKVDGSPLPAWLSFNPSSLTFLGMPLAGNVGSIGLRLTATDTYGVSAEQNVTLTVTNFPVLSTLSPLANQVINIGRYWQWQLPNQTFTDPDGEVLLYRVQRQDGSELPSWLNFTAANLTFWGLPNLTNKESYVLSVVVEDPHGAKVSGEFTLTAEHFPRSSQVITLPLAGVGKMFSSTISTNSFVDEDGEPLLYSCRKVDGSPLPPWLSFNPSSLTFLGMPLADDVGSTGLRLTAMDSYGVSAQQNVTLMVTNFPVLSAVIPNQVINISRYWQWQLANQTFVDPDDEVLLYQARRQDGSELPAWLNFSASNLTFWGLPNLTNKESYVLSVVVEDPHGAKANGEFTLTAEHFPRLSQAITLPLAGVGKTFSASVSNSFVDDDGESLVYVCRQIDGSLLPEWLSFNPSSLTFLGTPFARDVGSVGLRLTAMDMYGASAEQNVSLTVTNFPVLSAALPNQVANISQYYQWQLPNQTFIDPDGEVLLYQVQRQDGSSLPSWLNFTAANLTFWGVPNLPGIQSYPLSVTVSDPHGAKVSGEFILVAEHFPRVNQVIRFEMAAVGKTFIAPISPTSFVDEDNEPLIYSARKLDGSPLPSWLSFNPTLLTFAGVPLLADVGSVVIRCAATDPHGASVEQNVTLKVTYFPILQSPLPDQVINISQPYQWRVPNQTFAGFPGEVLLYQAQRQDGSKLPDWLRFDAQNLTFSGLPNLTMSESYALSIIASNSDGANVTGDFRLVADHFPQVQSSIEFPVMRVGELFNWLVPSDSFKDEDGDLIYKAQQDDNNSLPAWLSFNSRTLTFSGTPSASGILGIRLIATDSYGISASQTFNVTTELFPSASPILKDQSALVWKTGKWFNFTVPPNVFSEGSGGKLTYSASQTNGIKLPSWLSFDNNSLTFRGTPDMARVLSLEVHAQDGSGANVTAPLTLDIQSNVAPRVRRPISRQTAVIEELFNLLVPSDTFDDPNGDPLNYSARQLDGSPLPGWLKFSGEGESLSFTGKPSRLDAGLLSDKELALALSAQDDEGLQTTLLFNLVVEGSSYLILFLKIGLPILSGLVTAGTYLLWRKNAYQHRRGYDLAYYVGRELNLKYVDFGKEEGEQYKTQMVRFLDRLNQVGDHFYLKLSKEERKSFAVCVASQIRARDDLLKDADFMDAGLNRLLGYGRKSIQELNLDNFEQAMPELVQASLGSWRSAVECGESPVDKWKWEHPQPKLEKMFDQLTSCCGSRQPREEKLPRRSGVTLFGQKPVGEQKTSSKNSKSKDHSSDVELETLYPPVLEPATSEKNLEIKGMESRQDEGVAEDHSSSLGIDGEPIKLDGFNGLVSDGGLPRPSQTGKSPRMFNSSLPTSPSANSSRAEVSISQTAGV
jgi:hypothetical protein